MRQPLDHLPAGRFFGRNTRLVKQQGLTLSEVHYVPGQKVPPHGHQLAYFCLLVDGGYWEQYGRRRVDYAPHSIVFHPPGDEHYGDISPAGGRCFNIEACPEWMERLSQHGKIPRQPAVFQGGELSWLASRLYREFRHRQAGLPLLIEGLGLEMLGALLGLQESPQSRAPGWLRQAAERLREEMGQPLTLQLIAEDAGVSPVRLSRGFRRFYGESPGSFLRRIRIEEACKRLRNPEIPLVNVALETGFADQSHFGRIFKRSTGMTPGQFRKVAAGRDEPQRAQREDAEGGEKSI